MSCSILFHSILLSDMHFIPLDYLRIEKEYNSNL